MNIENIVDYAINSPTNTNPNVLRGMINEVVEEATEVETCKMTLIASMSNVDEDYPVDFSYVNYTNSQQYNAISMKFVYDETSKVNIYSNALRAKIGTPLGNQLPMTKNQDLFIYKNEANLSILVTGATVEESTFYWVIHVKGDFSIIVNSRAAESEA